MDRILEIPELLAVIFEHLYYDSDTYCGTLALALTCKRFQEPALDVLWSFLPHILPLFKCLPEDAVDFPTISSASSSDLYPDTVEDPVVSDCFETAGLALNFP
jgi:hypothetical protein